MARAAEYIHQAMEFSPLEYESTGTEGPQVEGFNTKELSGFRVCVQENLEAAVQEKALDLFRSQPASYTVRALKKKNLLPLLIKTDGTGEPGEPGTYDDDPVCALLIHLSQTALMHRCQTGFSWS